MTERKDERLRSQLASANLSRPGVGLEDVMRRAARQQRERRAMVRLAMAAVGVWLLAWVAGIAVERSVTAAGQGSMMPLTSVAAERNAEMATGWLVWQRRVAEGLAVEDLGTAPRVAPRREDGPRHDERGMREGGTSNQVDRVGRRRAYV